MPSEMQSKKFSPGVSFRAHSVRMGDERINHTHSKGDSSEGEAGRPVREEKILVRCFK